VLCELSRGDSVTLSTLTATVHLGSHADGPNHYAIDGRSIDRQPLDHYIGECIVVSASTSRGGRVLPADLSVPIAELASRRVLIRTKTHRAGAVFDDGFAGLSVELVERLAAIGVITVGVDTPSVDTFDSKDLPAHNAIHRADIAILEGLVLEGVGDGRYELIAPPLKLEGFDASPVRAVLRAT
jgi:arylformamidase